MLDSCRMLQQDGFDVTYLQVEKSTGLVNMEEYVCVLVAAALAALRVTTVVQATALLATMRCDWVCCQTTN